MYLFCISLSPLVSVYQLDLPLPTVHGDLTVHGKNFIYTCIHVYMLESNSMAIKSKCGTF